MIVSMIQGMTEDKEKKMKEKNLVLMRKIKKLEKKKQKLLHGEKNTNDAQIGSADLSDEEDELL